MENEKPLVLIVGPVNSNGGISQVINAVTDQSILLDNFKIIKINTSQYKDSGLLGEMTTFANGLIKYLYVLINLKPQIIHIHTSANISFYRKSIFGFIATMIFKRKVVYHIHASNFYQFFCKSSNAIVEKLIIAIFKRAERIVCLCNNWAISLKKKYNIDNCSVITNPVKVNLIQKTKKDNSIKKINLLYMGFYIQSKGIIDLLETFNEIYKKNDSIRLYLCGKGELNDYINRFIRKNSLMSQIINVGWVSGKEKDYYYQKADIFLLPSYKEGVPIAILEAFSYGLPVISTSISGIPEILKNKENGFLIQPGDRNDLERRIDELLKKPILREKIRVNNLKQIKQHHPKRIALKWYRLYKKLL